MSIATRRTKLRRPALSVLLALLAAGALLLASALVLPHLGQDRTIPERVLLSPTTDPATSQHVTWRTKDLDERAHLEFSATHQSAATASVPAEPTGEAADHQYYRATLTDLTPGTEYRYRIVPQEEAAGDWQVFSTAEPEPRPFDFLYFGDVQNDIDERAAPVVRAALEAEPEAELAVHVGDMIDHADDDSEWGEWYDAFGTRATARINHVVAPGNHEYASDRLSGHWALQFPGTKSGPPEGTDLAATLHHTDYQGVRFIGLNSNYRDIDVDDVDTWLELQTDWLAPLLEDNPHEWTVVTFHHPLFSNNPSRDNAPLRRAWLETMEEYDVDLVLQGHDHSYSRGNLIENRTEAPDSHTGPVYVTAVTGPKMYEATDHNWTDHGAEARVQVPHTQTYQTVSVSGSTLEFVSATADGEVVDAFTITKDQDGKLVTDQN